MQSEQLTERLTIQSAEPGRAQNWAEVAQIHQELTAEWAKQADIETIDGGINIYKPLGSDKNTLPVAADLLVVAAEYKAGIPPDVPDTDRVIWDMLDSGAGILAGKIKQKDLDINPNLRGDGFRALASKLFSGDSIPHPVGITEIMLLSSDLIAKNMPAHPSTSLNLNYANEKQLRASNRLSEKK